MEIAYLFEEIIYWIKYMNEINHLLLFSIILLMAFAARAGLEGKKYGTDLSAKYGPFLENRIINEDVEVNIHKNASFAIWRQGPLQGYIFRYLPKKENSVRNSRLSPKSIKNFWNM